MIEEPFQRALKLEVFANTIRRDLSDLLHVSEVSPAQLNITSDALGYEVPFSCRLGIYICINAHLRTYM
jgi:hypothetical protein